MIGKTISHYKIDEKLGEGGMGVVYKAQDTKLDRFVALKFLPERVADSEQDRARFMHEAKAASALNHPNVCTIYGIEEHEGQMFLVMEFVEGQTLTNRKHGLSVKQVVDIGIQLSEGLAAAHEKGIVHRDIKPDNIMIRKDGIAQIMDFGLAKLRGVSRLTKEGSTVGTAGYMSPEQVQGQDVDHRSDIFSIGVVLYELFSGQLPFRGVHETALLYEIVNVDPSPISAVKPDTDPVLDAIVMECLEKDPNERTQSAKQIAVLLKKYQKSSGPRSSRVFPSITRPSAVLAGSSFHSNSVILSPRVIIGFSFLAILFFAIGFYFSSRLQASSSTQPVIRSVINTPSSVHYVQGVGGHSVISRDGKHIVYAAIDSVSNRSLWIYNLESGTHRILAGTDDASYPFWSPDNQSVGFFAQGKLKTASLEGGPIITLADAPFGRGGAWSTRDIVIYAPNITSHNLLSIPAYGGTPKEITEIDSTMRRVPRFPSFLPDGNHFVFALIDLGGDSFQEKADLYLGQLDSPEIRLIQKNASNAYYSDKHLLTVRQSILIALPFDPGAATIDGKLTSIQNDVNTWLDRAKSDFSVSDNNIVVYTRGSNSPNTELVWIDSNGFSSAIGELPIFEGVSLSPAYNEVAYSKLVAGGKSTVITIFDVKNRIDRQITASNNGRSEPVWSPDGKYLYYGGDLQNGGKAVLYAKTSDGSGVETILYKEVDNFTDTYVPQDVSNDGRHILFISRYGGGSILLTYDTKGKSVKPLGIASTFARFSPDGKWIIYVSSENDGVKMFVSSFSGIEGKWQVPTEGGDRPFWSGSKIYYYSQVRDYHEMCDVRVQDGVPQFGQPRRLFDREKVVNIQIRGVVGQGDKFFGTRPANAGDRDGFSVITNWPKLLKKNQD